MKLESLQIGILRSDICRVLFGLHTHNLSSLQAISSLCSEFPHKMELNIDMFCSLANLLVLGQEDRSIVIFKNNRGVFSMRYFFQQHLMKLHTTRSLRQLSIFSFSRTLRHSIMSSAISFCLCPTDCGNSASHRSPSIWTISEICINKTNDSQALRPTICQSLERHSLNVSHSTSHRFPLIWTWTRHVASQRSRSVCGLQT